MTDILRPVSDAFRVLYVCTGNVCRSAAAERMLLHRATPGDRIEVASAGTGALEGYGIDGPTVAALAEVGVDGGGHRAAWLDETMIAEANLVLTATTEHRDRVLRMAPTAMRRTFTMREFARLGAGVEGAHDHDDRVRVVREVAGRRGQVDPPAPGEDEVGDPFGAGIEEARRMVHQVGPTVDATVRLLGLAVAR